MQATNYIKPLPYNVTEQPTVQEPDCYTGKPITLDGRLFDLVYTAMGISENAWIIKNSLYGGCTPANDDIEINEIAEEPYLESIDDKIRFLEKELSHISQTLKEVSEFIK